MIFFMPHLFRHAASVFEVSSEGLSQFSCLLQLARVTEVYIIDYYNYYITMVGISIFKRPSFFLNQMENLVLTIRD